MVQDVNEVVDSGFMNLFQLAKQAGKLLASSYFILAESTEALLPLVVFALGSLGFIASSYKSHASIREAVSDTEASVVEVAQEGSLKYRLFADYYARPQLQAMLKARVDKLDEATKPLAKSEVDIEYFPQWLSVVLATGWMIYGGEQVLAGKMQLGNYLATVNVFKNVGETFKDLFIVSVELSKAIAPLDQITTVLNLPTNLRQLKRINRARRSITKKHRTPESLYRYRRISGRPFGTDAIPIAIQNLTFMYPRAAEPALCRVYLSVAQGSFITIVGKRRSGKSTLLKLLGQVLLPSHGSIFIPSYLRVLYVTGDPIMLTGSLWKNLAIGRMYWTNEEYEMNRVLRICRRIGFSESQIEYLEQTATDFRAGCPVFDADSTWRNKMTSTDLVLIHLARAFIYSPEVLIMDRPAQNLPSEAADSVITLLREFCDYNGLELPADGLLKRRPRTVIISSARVSALKLADVAWQVGNHKVYEINKTKAIQVFHTTLAEA